MVTVSLAAERFLETLIQRLSTISAYPPSHQTLRSLLLEWFNKIPIVELREYFLANFNTHVSTVHAALTKHTLTGAFTAPSLQQFQLPSHSSINVKTSSSLTETIPYLSTSPNAPTYAEYLKHLISVYEHSQNTPHPSLTTPFWDVLSTILSPCPLSFNNDDTLSLFETKFTFLFDFLVRFLPIEQHRTLTNSTPLQYKQFQRTLQLFSQTFVSSIFDYISHFPLTITIHHIHLLTRAITVMCLLLSADHSSPLSSSNETVDSVDSTIWLTTIIQTISSTVPTFNTTQFYVELLAFWSHFILIPSMCFFTHQSKFIQNPKYTLLHENEFNSILYAAKYSPAILLAITPYFKPILTTFNPTQTPEIYTHGITTSTLLFICSMFQHISPALRFYNTSQHSSPMNLQQLKTALLELAKTIQQVTIHNETALLPSELQILCQRYTLRCKNTQRQKDHSSQQPHKPTPLLSSIEDNIVNFKDLFTNSILKSPIKFANSDPTQPSSPYSTGLEILVLSIQKTHVDYSDLYITSTSIAASKKAGRGRKQQSQDSLDILLSSLTVDNVKRKKTAKSNQDDATKPETTQDLVAPSLEDELFQSISPFSFDTFSLTLPDDGDDFGSSTAISFQLNNLIHGVSEEFAKELNDFGDIDIQV